MMRLALSPWIFGLVLAALPAGAAEEVGCEPSAEWQKTAPALQRETAGCKTDLECLKRMHGRWQELLAKMPRDMRTHWNYGRAFAETEAAPMAIEYLKAKVKADPKDPFYATA